MSKVISSFENLEPLKALLFTSRKTRYLSKASWAAGILNFLNLKNLRINFESIRHFSILGLVRIQSLMALIEWSLISSVSRSSFSAIFLNSSLRVHLYSSTGVVDFARYCKNQRKWVNIAAKANFTFTLFLNLPFLCNHFFFLFEGCVASNWNLETYWERGERGTKIYNFCGDFWGFTMEKNFDDATVKLLFLWSLHGHAKYIAICE